MKFLTIISLFFLLTSCWPMRVTFVDDTMPEEWKTFHIDNLENNAANTPLSYSTYVGLQSGNGGHAFSNPLCATLCGGYDIDHVSVVRIQICTNGTR